jgi:hypothetical protein
MRERCGTYWSFTEKGGREVWSTLCTNEMIEVTGQLTGK